MKGGEKFGGHVHDGPSSFMVGELFMAGEIEIEKHRAAVRRHEHVGRLQITVENALLVNEGQGFG